ncbi:MAG: DksA/TraR family C4-type zinc finger protein [Gammaproteobacteria bacterium]
MAGGWAPDNAVNDQIERSIKDELSRLKAEQALGGESLTHCAECDEPIPEARRKAIPGVRLCVECQQEREQDADSDPYHGVNRRGSKDSQLR